LKCSLQICRRGVEGGGGGGGGSNPIILNRPRENRREGGKKKKVGQERDFIGFFTQREKWKRGGGEKEKAEPIEVHLLVLAIPTEKKEKNKGRKKGKKVCAQPVSSASREK